MVKTNVFGVFWGSASLFLCLSCPSQTQAQVVPDSTLPVNSAVTVDGSTTTITGGTRAGSNLFHSFEQFSVTTNGTAFFNNPLNIENILTRVTGGSISNIDGLIQGNGSANLFLLNPNGIVFGPNARLDIGGSFLASTASSVVFADGNFSATDPNNTPLLSVNVPLGVQFGATANAIANQSTVTDSNSAIVGLQVNAGETLALLGGDLNLEGGHLNAQSGRIELGSVAPNSQVNLTVKDTGLTLGYEGVRDFQDIQLSQQAVVSTSSLTGGGDIQIQARELSAIDSSTISSVSVGEGKAGNISIQASDRVEVAGTGNLRFLEEILNDRIDPSDFVGGIFTSGFGAGGSGDLTIGTKELELRDGAVFSASTFGSGSGGSLNINAPGGSVELIGSGLLTGTTGSGNSGDLTIATGQLTLKEGAVVSTATVAGAGQGGKLVITADSVELTGESTEPLDLPIFVQARPTPPEGELEFTELEPQPIPSSLLAVTFGAGNSGNVEVTVSELKINEGAAISTATLGAGNGGNITIREAELVELIGSDRSALIKEFLTTGSIDPSDINDGFFSLSLPTRDNAEQTGDIGSISIETQKLTLENGAGILSTTFTQAKGALLSINATESLELSGGSVVITGTGRFGAAGDLSITTGNLTIRDAALISTATFSLDTEGRGGNLTVITPPTGRVELIGAPASVSVPFPSSQFPFIPTGLQATSVGNAPAGALKIETGELMITEGAAAASAALRGGSGGQLTVNADSVQLIGTSTDGRLQSGLFAFTETNAAAGSLEINTGTLIMRDGAVAETTAFVGNAQGGNVSINANIIAAIENSRIIANAFAGGGGNIQIAARRGIFQSADSDITASSQLGIDGSVSLNTPDIQSDRELVDLPEEVTDTAEQVARVCQKDREGSSSFTIAGRGGLPPRPSEPLSSEALVGFDSLSQSAENVETLPESDEIALAPPARGWFVNDRGELVLSWQPLNVMSQGSSFSAAKCDVR